MTEERFQQGEASVERRARFDVDPDQLWQHLTDGALVSTWMGGDVEIEVRPGGRIRLVRDTGPEVWGTVEEVIEGRRIQWSWRTDEGLPTLVEIEIIPGDGGTDLTVTETLLPWRVDGASPRFGRSHLPEARLGRGISLAA